MTKTKTKPTKRRSRTIVTADDHTPPKALWVGDAGVNTGFARCTHAVCDVLHANGWGLRVAGINYIGDPTPHPYPLYQYRGFGRSRFAAHGYDPFCSAKMCDLLYHDMPDVLIIQQDPWNVAPYVELLDHVMKQQPAGVKRPKLVLVLAVDSMNSDFRSVERADLVIFWTDFGLGRWLYWCRENSVESPPTVVTPPGCSFQTPNNILEDKWVARQRTIPESKLVDEQFIVSVVGRNQQRKRLDIAIHAFALFVNEVFDGATRDSLNDSLLFIHSAPTGEGAYDLMALARFYGVQNQVVVSDPGAGYGYNDTIVRDIYATSDALLVTSQAEGFCLPVLEAMVLGVPPVYCRWGGLTWFPVDCGYPVEKSQMAVNDLGYGSRNVAFAGSAEGFADGLRRAFLNRSDKDMSERCIRAAKDLTWDRYGQEVAYAINKLIS